MVNILIQTHHRADENVIWIPYNLNIEQAKCMVRIPGIFSDKQVNRESAHTIDKGEGKTQRTCNTPEPTDQIKLKQKNEKGTGT